MTTSTLTNPTEPISTRILARMPDEVDLVDVSHTDQLTTDQIRALLDGEDIGDGFFDWLNEAQRCGADYWMSTELTDDERDELEEEPDGEERIREALNDRDRTCALQTLIDQTGRRMLEFDLHEDIDPTLDLTPAERMRLTQRIARAARIPWATNRAALEELVEEASYGGRLYVLNHTDVGDVLDAIACTTPQWIRFTDPLLVIHDHFNGSGHMVSVTGTVATPLVAEEIRLDEGRMSWSDDIAGLVHHTCACETAISTRRGPSRG